MQTPGETEVDRLMNRYGGCIFEDGLYRIHSHDEARQWGPRVASAFPQLTDAVTVFGQDWQGNQFGWRGGNEPMVFLLLIAAGDW